MSFAPPAAQLRQIKRERRRKKNKRKDRDEEKEEEERSRWVPLGSGGGMSAIGGGEISDSAIERRGVKRLFN